jgi:hypothetical protein
VLNVFGYNILSLFEDRACILYVARHHKKNAYFVKKYYASDYLGCRIIASNPLAGLNSENIEDILIVDNFSNSVKNKNLDKKKYHEKVERSDFFRWLSENPHSVSFIFHLGARTDTTEHNKRVFDD